MSEDAFALRDEMHRFEQELSFAISKNILPETVNSGNNNLQVPPQRPPLNRPTNKPLFTQFIPNQLVKKGVAPQPQVTPHLQVLQPPPGYRPPQRTQFLHSSQVLANQQQLLYNGSAQMGNFAQPVIMTQLNNPQMQNVSNLGYPNLLHQQNTINSSNIYVTSVANNISNQSSSDSNVENQSKIYVAAPSIKYQKPPSPTSIKKNIPPALQHLIKSDDKKLNFVATTALIQPTTTIATTKDSKNINNSQGENQKVGTKLITSIEKSINLEKVKDKKKKKKKKKKEQEDLSVPTSKPRPKKSKIIFRHAAGSSWVDGSLLDWDPNDYRIFCGDLGNEVSDDVLTRAFNRYPSFQRARVIRDKRNNKTKGFGFVSFKDATDYAKAMKEMNGRYVGSRPIKLRKSTWNERGMDAVRKKNKEKQNLINQIKAIEPT